jgi:YbbR domain-containing protein
VTSEPTKPPTLKTSSARAKTATAKESGDRGKRPERKNGWFSGVTRFIRGALFENASLKFVALVLSITIFVMVNTEEDAVISIDVEIAYTMPEDRVLISEPVDKLRVSVEGSWRRVRRFDERELDPIRVDLTNMPSGEFVFQKEMIRLPRGLRIRSISPLSMRLVFDKRVSKEVKVVVPLAGTPQRGYKLAGHTHRPQKVMLRGPAGELGGLEEIRTRDVNLDNKSDSFRAVVPVITRNPRIEVVGKREIEVNVQMEPELVAREIGPLPVTVRAGSGIAQPVKTKFVTKPAAVSVVLRGPVAVVDVLAKDAVEAYVQLYAEDAVTGKTRKAAVLLHGVPEGVGVEIRPRVVELKMGQ